MFSKFGLLKHYKIIILIIGIVIVFIIFYISVICTVFE